MLPWIATALLGAGVLAVCGGNGGGRLDEAVEEIRDEAGDAREQLEDEIDDNS